jgi:DNA-binding transcriptional LysR family regulator
VPFGYHYLLPLLPGFLAEYPQVEVDVVLTDRVVDLFEERADVAIRTGPLRESRLVARKLGESRLIIVASPDYLSRHGEPKTLADLKRHNQLGFCFTRHIQGWPFIDENGASQTMALAGNALVSDGEALRQVALAGLGLARLSSFHITPDITAGRLVPVLEKYNPHDIETMHAVFVGQGGHLPARVRAFLDYLSQHVRFP